MTDIRFFCPHCRSLLMANASTAGDEAQCPNCRQGMRVPRKSETHPNAGVLFSAYPSDVLSVDIRFLCSACGRKLKVDARAAGARMVCPLCGATITLPQLPVNLLAGDAPVASPREAGRRIRPVRPVLTAEEIGFLMAPLPDTEADAARLELPERSRRDEIVR